MVCCLTKSVQSPRDVKDTVMACVPVYRLSRELHAERADQNDAIAHSSQLQQLLAAAQAEHEATRGQLAIARHEHADYKQHVCTATSLLKACMMPVCLQVVLYMYQCYESP